MAEHTFEPRVFYNTIGWHEPVLRIAPGDTVHTTTIDAAGVDMDGNQRAPRGNPMTGPFYIEGAEEGDTLVVSLDRLRTNRPTGWTATSIAPNVLDPGESGLPPERTHCEWAVDPHRGVVSLASLQNELTGVELPLSPMVGCFGVAPPRQQAISTATSSTHGGNMDYRGFVEGVVVYFPVAAEGALFHIGDGHAIQGDGEIVGTGVEISFDVSFTVDLLKGETIGWPRFENDAFIGTVGNARPLDQCVQHATSEMLRWLQDGYGMDARVAHLLLGQCVHYDMGNVYDPAYTMVCKVAKEILDQVGVSR